MRIVNYLQQHLRLSIQLAATALGNGYLAGFLKGRIYSGQLKKFCLPGLNCYSCPGALGSCPLGSLQAVLGSKDYKFSFYITGFFLFTGALLGRFVCGFLCPFGLFQDLLYKIPVFGKLKKLKGDRYLLAIKYILLGLFVILLPLVAVDIIGQGKPWFCQYLCPSGMLMGGIPLYLSNAGIRQAAGGLFLYKLGLLAAVVLLSIKIYRPFCRYLCPLGAIYGLFNPIAFTRFAVDETSCTKCGKCHRVCKMDLAAYEEANSRLCIRCGDCMKNCPRSAIGYQNSIIRAKDTVSKTKCSD